MPGLSRVVYLVETDLMPAVGDLVMFGRTSSQATRVIVRGIEAGSDLSSIVHAIPAAEVIDEILDATEIPAWSSRVGAELAEDAAAPGMPVWIEVASGITGTDEADQLVYRIGPGDGVEPVATYEIRHRIAGAPNWTIVLIPAAAAGGVLDYASGITIELQAVALSAYGQPSAATAILTVTVGGADGPAPAALDESTIAITALLGGALVQFAVSDDPATAEVQVYRSTSAILDRETDAAGAPISVVALQSYSVALGDTARATLIVDGNFAEGSAWDTGSGWSIADGMATHAVSVASALSQAVSLIAGKTYRVSYTVSGRTSGTVTAQLIGSSTVSDTAISTNGDHAAALVAPASPTTFTLLASSDFDGSIDDVTLYMETSACLSQDTHYIWLEPQSAAGVPGQISGPWAVVIV